MSDSHLIDTTSESLLIQLQAERSDDAWSRFVGLYTPLLFFWARKCGLQNDDAADLVQDVLSIVFLKLPGWHYDRTRSFRGWLRTITLNRHRELLRKQRLPAFHASDSLMANLVSEDEAASHWDVDYARRLVESSMESQASNFAPRTWEALMEMIRSGDTATSISKKCEVSVWTLYAAKNRLMSRIRRELDGLL